ncbi:MAG TPA: ABC transporter permease [Anaerolineae bacterium]|nr:ABC transporter permease [Anaerolineae bacterium]
MRILDLATKDLKQLLRDRKAAFFLIVMPIAFTLLFSFLFGGQEEEDPRLEVGFVDQDGGVLSAHLLSLLEASDTVRPVALTDVTTAEARQQVRDGDLAAVLIVPAGYSDPVLTLSGDLPSKPVLIADRDSDAGRVAENGVQTAVARLLESAQAAQLAAQAYQAQGGTADAAFIREALERAIGAWAEPPVTITVRRSGAAEAEPGGDYGTAHASAGMLVQFAMAGLMGASGVLVLERKSGALRRLLTTPISRLGILLGHFLAMLVMILLQLAILVAFGQLALGVEYLRTPVATLLMVLATALWSAGMGLLLGVVARTEEQAMTISIVAMLLLSALGGAWIPLEFTGPAFQAVGHLMPTAWAVDGFENLVIRGLGIESVLLPAAILLAYTAGFFGLAVWRFAKMGDW